jgi:hypothetical protein
MLYYSTKGNFDFLRIQWTMTISIWKGKPCSCFIGKHFSFSYLLFGFIEHLWHEKAPKASENIPRMSAEEWWRLIGMLQNDCSIRKFKFWKCYMLISLFLLWAVLTSIHKKICRLHGSCIVTIRVSVNCSKRPEVLLTAINNPGVEWYLFASKVKYCFHIKGI